MALNCSLKFKCVIVQILSVLEIQLEAAWALTNLTSENICHVYLVPNFMHLSHVILKMIFKYFLGISVV